MTHMLFILGVPTCSDQSRNQPKAAIDVSFITPVGLFVIDEINLENGKIKVISSNDI